MSRKYRVAILGLGHWYSAYNLARSLPDTRAPNWLQPRGPIVRNSMRLPRRSAFTDTRTITTSWRARMSTSCIWPRRCRR